ncbi:mediator of RNA polymerase II transcription subunit 26-like [Physella acuta]|uniref:mediator of RNA polymerase II transcription subunit 26-like n=1 Tax=Physella acuta TaxID=109671 RepID=UPI0027DAF83B|nr:mediator of RNA polymerase II transcription subunit 26-like [Physella acuta]
MTLTPAQIKDKLTKALDGDKNVIDEKAVQEVITLLEASTITKEILEQTRLGRDINLVRKISKNPDISKRAKNLVKAWKKLIPVPGSPQVANGQHPVKKISPGLSPASSRCSTPVTCLPSPALIMRQQVMKGAGSRSPVVQPVARAPLPPSKLAQHDLKQKQGLRSKSPKPNSLRQASINDDSNLSWPRTPPSMNSESSQDRLIGDRENQDSVKFPIGSDRRNFNFDNSHLVHSTVSASKSANSCNRASDQRDVSKTNVANRKRTRPIHLEDSNDLSAEPSSKQPRLVSSSPSLSKQIRSDVINGEVNKKSHIKSPAMGVRDSLVDPKTFAASTRSGRQELPDASITQNRSHQKLPLSRQDSIDSRLSVQSSDSRGFREKLSKVKTTEQLIEDMQRKSATTVGTSIIAQIRTNQIRKDLDSQKNVPPSSSKRKGRKKRGSEMELPDTESVSDGRKLAQTKSEYIERFLQTSVAPTPGEDSFEHSLQPLRQEEEQSLVLGGCSATFNQSSYESGYPSYSSRQDKPDSGPSASPPEAWDVLDHPSHLPSTSTLDTLERLSEEQLLARLPPLDLSNIDWAIHDYQSPEPVPVTESLVKRLHEEHLEGINGTFDRDGQFKSWHQMLTMDSVYDEPLYILPYVIPND